MANKKILIISWLLLAFIGLGSGIRTLTVYNQSLMSVFAGSMQILGSIILLIVVFMVYKKKET